MVRRSSNQLEGERTSIVKSGAPSIAHRVTMSILSAAKDQVRLHRIGLTGQQHIYGSGKDLAKSMLAHKVKEQRLAG